MEDPKTAQKLENTLLNGYRPLITVFKAGQVNKMFLETAVRCGKLNFYRQDGKPEKHEQSLKETSLEVSNSFSKKMEQGKQKMLPKAKECRCRPKNDIVVLKSVNN